MELLRSPLWQASVVNQNLQQSLTAIPPAPVEWQARLQRFKDDVLALDPSFAIWLEWLDDRLDGKPATLQELKRWTAIPDEVAAQGPAKVNAYLAAVIHGEAAQPLNRVRTIFIGYGEAGKTSLIRALHGEAVVEGKETMTPGIQIREWDGAGQGLLTHFWDFGGQVMAHATHQFFLRSSCLYVLVLSARAEVNATEQAEYWLQHVQAFGAGAPVMLVGNKCDQIPLHLEMGSLREKYPNIVGYYPLSSTQAQAGEHLHKFQDFRAAFCAQLRTVGLHQMLFTKKQFSVLQQVRALSAKQAFLAREAFADLCRQNAVSDDGEQNRAWLLDILDKLGVVIHFKQLAYLDGFVLNPRWLTYGVYTVMYAGRARIDEQQIVALLTQAVVLDENGQRLPYEAEKCFFIAKAMQEFKLCYCLPHDSKQMIIPGLLPADLPPGLAGAKFNKAQALAFKIAFTGFVPRHVMPEMAVMRNEEIVNELVWQYGVLLADRESGARAMLQVDYQARELTVWVEGTDAKEYLGVLRRDLTQILRRMTLLYREWIRLPAAAMQQRLGTSVEEDWVEYQVIETCRRNGLRHLPSSQGMYDLAELVGLYIPQHEQSGGALIQYHIHGNATVNNPGVEMGNTINIKNSSVGGSVHAGDVINSHNTTTGSGPEVQDLLRKLLAEIESLNAKVPAAQRAQVADLQRDTEQLLAESQREIPRLPRYQVFLDGVKDGLGKLGDIANSATAIFETVSKAISG